ncbi:hypothetical protein [Paracoccus benzoatiresistens]|uniref:Uncharacterized protein n=1 Tax=Paracoccus benzoatiresistens TaxID=2997341 RepID=A0ABT4J8V1_9RHOB|nr:hypothetical protein [Paracoccus sp. EF6]MCZ0962861.1 hypothetical protein [Paracoccus sp. EF6]
MLLMSASNGGACDSVPIRPSRRYEDHARQQDIHGHRPAVGRDVPLNKLDEWLTFYRKQRADFPKAGSSYDVAIAGLEALTEKLAVNA